MKKKIQHHEILNYLKYFQYQYQEIKENNILFLFYNNFSLLFRIQIQIFLNKRIIQLFHHCLLLKQN